jgi:hypothetical protein
MRTAQAFMVDIITLQYEYHKQTCKYQFFSYNTKCEDYIDSTMNTQKELGKYAKRIRQHQ